LTNLRDVGADQKLIKIIDLQAFSFLPYQIVAKNIKCCANKKVNRSQNINKSGSAQKDLP
jgi:hypothetical protein